MNDRKKEIDQERRIQRRMTGNFCPETKHNHAGVKLFLKKVDEDNAEYTLKLKDRERQRLKDWGNRLEIIDNKINRLRCPCS